MKNKYKISKKMWKQWTPLGKEIYNGIMDYADNISDRPEPFHNLDKAIRKHELTIIHNVAFLVACNLSAKKILEVEL